MSTSSSSDKREPQADWGAGTGVGARVGAGVGAGASNGEGTGVGGTSDSAVCMSVTAAAAVVIDPEANEEVNGSGTYFTEASGTFCGTWFLMTVHPSDRREQSLLLQQKIYSDRSYSTGAYI